MEATSHLVIWNRRPNAYIIAATVTKTLAPTVPSFRCTWLHHASAGASSRSPVSFSLSEKKIFNFLPFKEPRVTSATRSLL